MRLADWIDKQGLTRKAVADALGVSPPYVTMLCSEHPNWPGRDIQVKLKELTGAEVSATAKGPIVLAFPVESAA